MGHQRFVSKAFPLRKELSSGASRASAEAARPPFQASVCFVLKFSLKSTLSFDSEHHRTTIGRQQSSVQPRQADRIRNHRNHPRQSNQSSSLIQGSPVTGKYPTPKQSNCKAAVCPSSSLRETKQQADDETSSPFFNEAVYRNNQKQHQVSTLKCSLPAVECIVIADRNKSRSFTVADDHLR